MIAYSANDGHEPKNLSRGKKPVINSPPTDQPAAPPNRNGLDGQVSQLTDFATSQSPANRDPYRGVVLVLLAVTLLGTVAAFAGGVALASRELFAAAMTLGLSAGVLTGVVAAQIARAKPPQNKPPENEEEEKHEETPISTPTDETETPKSRMSVFQRLYFLGRGEPPTTSPDETHTSRTPAWLLDRSGVGTVRIITAVMGGIAIWLLLLQDFIALPLTPLTAAIAAAFCLGGAALAATATRYLAVIDPTQLPEAPGLCRGARLTGWVLVLTAISVGFAWMDQQTIVRILLFVVLTINAGVCYGLLAAKRSRSGPPETFPLDLGVLLIFGSRTNILASALDAAELQLGIDLRSTWALTVVRLTVEPLIICLCLLGWLSTSLTVVVVEEQGLVEHLGVPVGGQPLQPGLHLHWPWPVDQVSRIPVQRVQILTVGHEGEEGGGPENVLWAREHAANEYTLLLGNGRDLITVDGGVQFRIVDAPAWRYHCQNPSDAMRALAYRAVMRSTVNRTLSEALSENVAALTGRMRTMVQQDADALGLGVEVLGFTVGGMHPPVLVAGDYQAVVSAELGKVTAVVNAQAFRNRALPTAEAAAVTSQNAARAEGARALALAAGEAWSFRTLESEYRAAPKEFFFRRRLETLERDLSKRGFTVVDSRFQRDGGELWIVP